MDLVAKFDARETEGNEWQARQGKTAVEDLGHESNVPAEGRHFEHNVTNRGDDIKCAGQQVDSQDDVDACIQREAATTLVQWSHGRLLLSHRAINASLCRKRRP